MIRAAVYLRVSTQGQALDGYGLAAQELSCAAWADRNAAEIVLVTRDEGLSGSLPAAQRPGLVEALASLRDGAADVLVVARLDRLARDLTTQEVVLAEVWKLGRSLHTADSGEVLPDDPDDPMRRALRQMAGVFIELDKAMIVKRLRDGRRAKKANGEHGEGRYPYGWSKDGEVPAEQTVLAAIREMRATGKTWDEVTTSLNARGAAFAPRTAARWTPRNAAKVAAVRGD